MTTQQTKAVDWSQPIEAVHEDGRVVEAVSAGSGRASWNLNDHHFYEPAVMDDGRTYWNEWRIRNVGEPLQKMQQLRPGEPGYWEQQREQYAKNAKNPSPELTARMVALVREIAGHRGPDRMQSQWQCKAHAIAAELEPVDGDLQRARQIVCDNVPSWTDDHRRACMRGEYDGNLFVVIARRALAEAGK